jgi:Zn-dependent protease with chaperone function
MGRALLEAHGAQVADLIRNWCYEVRFTPDQRLDRTNEGIASSSGVVCFTAKSPFYRAHWQCKHSENATLVEFVLSPRLYCSLPLLGLSLFGLLYCILLIDRFMSAYSGSDIVTFTMCAFLSMLCGWWQRERIEPRLTQIEHSFWSKVQQSCDSRHVSYTMGRLYVPKLNLAIELVMAVCLVSLCGKLMGMVGVGISFLVCVLVITRHVVGILEDHNQYSQWHLCLMDNVTSWTLLMLMISGVFVVLYGMEGFFSQRLYLAEAPASIRQAFANAQFRQITPRLAHLLEDDCSRYFYGLAEHDFSSSVSLPDTGGQMSRAARIQHRVVVYGYIFMVIIWIPVYLCSVRPFWALLQTWALESTNHSARDGPSPLYLPQAWNWESALGVQCIVTLHYICGAVVNIVAAILCVDSLGYAFLGHSLLLANTANLCSWVFTSCKIALGPHAGQIAAVLTITALSLPLLFLTGACVRRVLSAFILWLRILISPRHSRSHPKGLWLQQCLTAICREHGIKAPALLLTRRPGRGVRLLHVLATNTTTIEVSTDILELLSYPELTAVMSHEIAHVRQGVWLINLLKAMSCFALFPNFYLTLLLDWASKEIDADQFAVTVTGDADALKKAIVKVSASQLMYVARHSAVRQTFWTRPIRMLHTRWNSFMASLRFFFGDGLLGYAHPDLSDRLRVIGNG